jgi:hypothetical protein
MLTPSGEEFFVNLSVLEWTSLSFGLGGMLAYVALFWMLLRRGLRSEFPFLVTYAAFSACANLFLFVVFLRSGSNTSLYFYSWWALNTVTLLLEFGVMYEVFSNVLKPFTALVDLGKILFRWAAVFLLVVASLNAYATAGSGMTKCIAAVALIERNLRLIQCGLLFLFFLFEKRLALSWRSHSVSLAIGLGISAALSLSFTFIRVHLTAWSGTLDLIDASSAFGIVVYWTVCFARIQPTGQTVLDSPSRLIFQRWNEALLSAPMTEDKNPALATVDSFLPGIEKTVDRVLARKIAN